MTTRGPVLPRTWTGRIQLVAAGILVLLAFAGTTAARLVDASEGSPLLELASAAAVTPADAPGEAATPVEGFTLADLAAGRVPQDVQDRFWQAQLDAIVAAPCPPPGGGGSVTLFLGADETWTARLEAATAAHRAACAA